MSRNFPAYTRLQSFITEQYEKETAARLEYFQARKSGDVRNREIKRTRGSNVPDGLPSIIPMDFARKVKQKEDRERKEIIKNTQNEQASVEMYGVSHQVKDKLYDGFTKNEKGRYDYLKTRKEVIPEEKYSFPVSSSMTYGWKLDGQFELARPRYARSSLVRDTFYTTNKIPTLEDPAGGIKYNRGRTIFC